MCHIRDIRRDDICLYLGPADRAELQTLITNRNTARKLVWRAMLSFALPKAAITAQLVAPQSTATEPTTSSSQRS